MASQARKCGSTIPARSRTILGGFADGLSKTELELGYYADELGNVNDRNGVFVRKTQAAINALNEQNEVAQRSRLAFSTAFQAIGDGAGRMAGITSQMSNLSGSMGATAQSMTRAFQSLDVGAKTFQSVQNLAAWFNEARTSVTAFNAAMNASTTTANGLKAAVAAIGGPWSLVAAASRRL